MHKNVMSRKGHGDASVLRQRRKRRPYVGLALLTQRSSKSEGGYAIAALSLTPFALASYLNV